MFNCPVSELIVQTFLTMIRPAFFFFFFLDLRNIFKNVSVGGGEKIKDWKISVGKKKIKIKQICFRYFFILFFVFAFLKHFWLQLGGPFANRFCKWVLQSHASSSRILFLGLRLAEYLHNGSKFHQKAVFFLQKIVNFKTSTCNAHDACFL